MGKIIDLVGKRFGRLLVLHLSAARSRRRDAIWVCQCDCGNIHKVTSRNLVVGATKSCGCLQKELVSARCSLDLAGQRFGRLIAIEKQGQKWVCQCDCGQISLVVARDLNSGHTRSCGCLHRESVVQMNRNSERRGKLNPYYKHGMSGTKAYSALQSQNRRARKAGSGGKPFATQELNEHVIKFDGKCYYCGAPWRHIDHIVPLSRGGKHEIDNLVTACAKCNTTKHNKLLGTEWTPPLVEGWT